MYPDYPGYGFGPTGGFFSDFGIFGVVFAVFVGLFVCVFAVFIVQGLRQWNRNNHSPKLTVPASVVAKRMKVSGGHGDTSASTWYYVTFQVDSGDRMELAVSGWEYGQLSEGDQGSLTFQGTRYLNFKRG